MKPRTTFMVFIHEPDFGADLRSEGNMANRVNGSARARAKPNMPTAGPIQLPEVTVSTSRRPMIGAVHEKDTRARVKAMRKIEMRPVALDALVSTELAHPSGSFISNHPKKDRAKTTRSRKRKMLNMELVESSLSLLGPKTRVMMMPNAR